MLASFRFQGKGTEGFIARLYKEENPGICLSSCIGRLDGEPEYNSSIIQEYNKIIIIINKIIIAATEPLSIWQGILCALHTPAL